MESKARAAASIAQARAELDRALAEIETIQTFDPALIGLVAHALGNYIAVTAATVEMLQYTLRGHPDGDVAIWLDGIGRTTDLMQHAVSRLVSRSAPRDFPLRLDRVNLAVLIERACEYHRKRAVAQGVHITYAVAGHVPPVWGDRVGLAVVADNLLSQAVRVSAAQGTVSVQIMSEPGLVVCSVRDAGPGFTVEEQAHLFDFDTAPASAGDGPLDRDASAGLSIAHQFVRRMDGELWCESEPGRGACLSFRLPAVE